MTIEENISLESKKEFERSDIVFSIGQKGRIQGPVDILAEQDSFPLGFNQI